MRPMRRSTLHGFHGKSPRLTTHAPRIAVQAFLPRVRHTSNRTCRSGAAFDLLFRAWYPWPLFITQGAARPGKYQATGIQAIWSAGAVAGVYGRCGRRLNLQFAGVLVNYDLPWNPMKVERASDASTVSPAASR